MGLLPRTRSCREFTPKIYRLAAWAALCIALFLVFEAAHELARPSTTPPPTAHNSQTENYAARLRILAAKIPWPSQEPDPLYIYKSLGSEGEQFPSPERAKIGKCTLLFGNHEYAYHAALDTHVKHNQLHHYPAYILDRSIQDDMWSKQAEFHERLRRIGAERYHDRHPFHARLHGGECSPDEVRAWVVNRWQYQSRIPMKDAAFMSRIEDPQLRRVWRSRIEDHDGGVDEGGGIRRWLALARAVGLDPDYVASGVGVMPATRFAVDAYVRFVRDMPLLDAVAASLTEMFAPKIHAERIEGLLKHYDFADETSLSYFRQRLTEARRPATGSRSSPRRTRRWSSTAASTTRP